MIWSGSLTEHIRVGFCLTGVLSCVFLQALLNLLLTGRATPYVFNGTQAVGGGVAPVDPPLQGVLSRGDIGYLHWSREQMDRGRLPQVQIFRAMNPLNPDWNSSKILSVRTLLSTTLERNTFL